VLADLTATLVPETARPAKSERGTHAAGRSSFVLAGLPVTVSELRAGLPAAGLQEHRPVKRWFGGEPSQPDLAVVVVGPLEEHLREAWTVATEQGGARPWRRFVSTWAHRDELPPTARVDQTVASWADRVGARNVHVVTTAVLAGGLSAVIGGNLLPGGPPPGAPARLTTESVDVLRRVNTVLPFLVDDRDRPARAAALVTLMRREHPGGTRIEVPRAHRPWVIATGVRLARAVEGTGCQVHGDLAELCRLQRSGEHLRPHRVLDEMVRMIRRADETVRVANPRGTA
jgi:hypothetical protein